MSHIWIPYLDQDGEFFNNELNVHVKTIVDVLKNGSLLDKNYNDAYDIIEKILTNDLQYPTTRLGIRTRIAGKLEVDAFSSPVVQISNLANIIKIMPKPTKVQEVKALEPFCTICSDNHIIPGKPRVEVFCWQLQPQKQPLFSYIQCGVEATSELFMAKSRRKPI
ncbi:hypothetical protein GQ457_08G026430 [Hibiscus cannabinus]